MKEAPSAAVASEEGEFLQQALQRPSLPSPPQPGHSVRPSVRPSLHPSIRRARRSAPRALCDGGGQFGTADIERCSQCV